MSDSVKGLTVSFSRDMSEEEAEEIVKLIKCIGGVADIKKSISDANTFLDRSRIKCELEGKLLEVLDE